VCALSLTCPPDPEKDGANDTTLLGKTRAAKVKKNIKKKDAPAKKKASDKAALAKRRAPSKAGSKAGSKPTLHIYDHCPFCIRAELVMGLNGVKYTRTLYGYGDSLGDSKGKYEGGRVLTGQISDPTLLAAILPWLDRLHRPNPRLALVPSSSTTPLARPQARSSCLCSRGLVTHYFQKVGTS